MSTLTEIADKLDQQAFDAGMDFEPDDRQEGWTEGIFHATEAIRAAAHDEEILRRILKSLPNSPQKWARLSQPTNDKFWTAEEQAVLKRAFAKEG